MNIHERYDKQKAMLIDAGRRFVSYLRYDPASGNGSWSFIFLDIEETPSIKIWKSFHRNAADFALKQQLADYTHHIP